MSKSMYKDCEIGSIPTNWNIQKLEELANVTGGKRLPKGSSLSEINNGHPYIRVSDMNDKGIQLDSMLYVPDDVVEQISRYRVDKDDLYISVAGTLGLVGKVPDELNGANLTENADRISNIRCNTDFLLYCLKSDFIKKIINSEMTTNAQPKLALTRIKQFPIPVPPLKEQQKIAEILSSVDAAIEKTEQVIAKTEEIKKGLMQQLLTKGIGHTEFKQTELGEIPVQWQVKKLADLGEALIGLTYSPDNITDESGTLVLRSSNIRGNRLSFDDNVYVDLDIPKRCVVQKDDILICVRNGSKALIGKSALIDNETVGCSFGAFMSVYRSKYNRYIFQLFNTELFKKQIYSNLGATINQITSANLKSFKFPIPPKEEQDKIVEILESYDSRVKIEEDKIKNLNLIKQGLMQQLLTGKTRVKID